MSRAVYYIVFVWSENILVWFWYIISKIYYFAPTDITPNIHFFSPPCLYLSIPLSTFRLATFLSFLAIYLFVFLSIFLYLSGYLFLSIFFYLAIYLFAYLFISLSIWLSTCISFYIYLSCYLSICIFFYISLSLWLSISFYIF